MVSYTPQFNPQPWVDFVDTVQAGGSNGFNARFQQIVVEFNTLSSVVNQLNAGLVFLPVGAAGAVAYGNGNVGIGTDFSAANPPTYRLQVDLDANTASTEQVRFGNAVCCNGGAGASSGTGNQGRTPLHGAGGGASVSGATLQSARLVCYSVRPSILRPQRRHLNLSTGIPITS